MIKEKKKGEEELIESVLVNSTNNKKDQNIHLLPKKQEGDRFVTEWAQHDEEEWINFPKL